MVYDVTLPLDANTHYWYKFATGESIDWGGNWEIVPSECGEGDNTDRFMDTGDEDMILDAVCFGSCEDCSDEPPTTVNVTFQVNMEFQETAANDGVYIRGGNIGSSDPANPSNGYQMSDEDGDLVYDVTLELFASTPYTYKFATGESINWGGNWETVPAECGVGEYLDRTMDTGEEDMTLGAVCFGSCEDCADDQAFVDVTFQVNMSGTDVSTDGVFLHGNWFGWGEIPMTDDDGDFIFEVTLTDQLAGSTGEYLFKNGGANEAVPNDCPNINDWGGGVNRLVTFPDVDTVRDPICFGMCEGDTCEGDSVSVTFQVDMSHNPEILEGHTVALQGEFADWWPGIVMADDNGDGIYTATVELAPGIHEYKFAGLEWTTTEFPDWSFTEDNAPSCLVLNNCIGENGECQFINRSVTVGASDATLSPVCWASCQVCGGGFLVNGDFEGDDSAWTPWIEGEPVEIDLSYTDDGPAGGSGEALRIVASDMGNGGVYQAVSLEENNVYELSGLFKGIGCDENWVEISILDYEPQQGEDVENADVIVKQNFWDCGAAAPWDWNTDFSNSCGGNPSMIGAPPGLFQAPATGVYFLLIKSGGVASDVIFDNLSLNLSDYVPTEGVSVTFNVDMSSVSTLDEGVYLARGIFGFPGENPMSDEDEDDIWTITVQLETNFATNYAFTNGTCADWGCKEDLSVLLVVLSIAHKL